jgi:4-carboxymuconolactone decarboxylase
MNPRYDTGLAILQQIYKEGGELMLLNLKDIAPDLGSYIVEMYGDLFSRPNLNFQQRQLITITTLASMGGCESQLKWHIQASLNIGLAPEEIIEAFIHCIPFHGFPRTLNAIYCAKQAFSDAGVTIEITSSDENSNERFDRGLAKLSEVDGQSGELVIESLADIAPDLGKLIIAFAFGDIYCRPVLNLQRRQLITLSSLTAQGNCEPQLHVHINAAIHVGLDAKEIVEIIMHTAAYTGFPKALNALNVAKQVFKEHQLIPVH